MTAPWHAGTALVTLADSENASSPQSVLGDGLALAAAALYAVYTVIMRYKLREDDADAVALMFGFVGLLVAVCLLPVLALQYHYGALDLSGVTLQGVYVAVATGECSGTAGISGRGVCLLSVQWWSLGFDSVTQRL